MAKEPLEQPDKPDKPKRPRKAYDIEAILHAALERRAAKLTLQWRRTVSISEALSEILKEELAEEIGELQDEPEASSSRRRK